MAVLWWCVCGWGLVNVRSQDKTRGCGVMKIGACCPPAMTQTLGHHHASHNPNHVFPRPHTQSTGGQLCSSTAQRLCKAPSPRKLTSPGPGQRHHRLSPPQQAPSLTHLYVPLFTLHHSTAAYIHDHRPSTASCTHHSIGHIPTASM